MKSQPQDAGRSVSVRWRRENEAQGSLWSLYEREDEPRAKALRAGWLEGDCEACTRAREVYFSGEHVPAKGH